MAVGLAEWPVVHRPTRPSTRAGRVPETSRPGPHHVERRLTLSEELEYPSPVAVKIKLMRLGKMRAPYYRIVVADSRTKRDGQSIEEIGKYHPNQDPSLIEVNADRLYTVVSSASTRDGVLDFTFTPGVRAYSFTFG